MPAHDPWCPALPAGARLLHVGVPKTGTTTLQLLAAERRAQLLEHGVCYPGTTWNHRLQIAALLGREQSGDRGPVGPARWEALAQEVRADTTNRVLISHEFAADADDAQAAQFRSELGPSLHVVVTLRGLPALLGPSWQQGVKWGLRQSFDDWLAQLLADPPGPGVSPGARRRYDHAGIVDRWCALLGPERVTVLVTDKMRPTLITDAFADLLALPRDLLRPAPGAGGLANRSLVWGEIELIRAVNGLVQGRGRLNRADHTRLVTNGAVRRVQAVRRPGPDEEQIRLPEWAEQVAVERAAAMTVQIAASGARIVGDLATLRAPVPTRTGPAPVAHVPLQVAAQALAGMAAAAVGRDGFFDDRPEVPGFWRPPAPRQPAEGSDLRRVPTAHLVAALAARPGRRGRRVLRRWRRALARRQTPAGA